MCMLRCELWVRVASKEDRFWGPFLRGLCKPHWGATGPWIHCGWLSARREQRSSHSQTDKGPHTSHKHLWVQRKTRQIQNCCGNRLTGWRLASSWAHGGTPTRHAVLLQTHLQTTSLTDPPTRSGQNPYSLLADLKSPSVHNLVWPALGSDWNTSPNWQEVFPQV